MSSFSHINYILPPFSQESTPSISNRRTQESVEGVQRSSTVSRPYDTEIVLCICDKTNHVVYLFLD